MSPTIIGNLSEEEMRRLHPEMFVEPVRVGPAFGQTMKEQAVPLRDMLDEADLVGRRIYPAASASRSKMGIMVLIENISGTKMVYGTDFSTWDEPDGPTLREAQAFRATRDACRQHLRTYSDSVGSNLAHFMSDEECEAFVTKLMAAGALKMRVLDVPAEAFA